MKPFILYATLGLTSLCGAWVFPRDLPDGVYHIEIPDKDDTKAKPLVKRANPEADLTFKPSFYGEDQWKYKSAHGVPENFRYWYEDVLEEPKHIKYAEKPKHSKKLEHFMNIKDGKKRKRPKNIETNVKFGELRRVKETAPLTEPNWLINRKKHKDPKHLVYAPQKDAPSLPVLDPPGDHGEVPVHALDKRCIYSKPRYDQHEADYEIARANLINYCSRWGLPSRSSHVSAARSGEVIVYACNLKWKDNICSAREYVWIEKQFLDSTCGHNTPGWAKVDRKGRMYGRGWTGDDICVDTGVEEFPVQNIIWAGRPPEWGNKNKPWFHKTVDRYINNLPLANGFTTPDRGFRAEWDLLRLDGMPDDEKSIKEKYKQRPRPPGGPYKPKTKEEQAPRTSKLKRKGVKQRSSTS
ncbi:hypothetical protein B0J13DRAFT_528975 [Dactylonectria estremocensis]|uniref:Uncharacterized protein n=1 Tax=Dactylonectria estremocensis TaxID=1079267 RepID=A0A9P9E920_9HYPO|nr:hypothetical protein B0J13DRAFT_528975 [Dactylonectria estremocensis]